MKGKSLTLIGTVMTLALTTNVAMAESSKSLPSESSDSSPSSPTEIQMSPEGMEILCKHFPLNSRCPGGIPLDARIGTAPTPVETSPVENSTTPSTTTDPAASSPVPDNSSQLTPLPPAPSSIEPGNSGSPNTAPNNSGNTNTQGGTNSSEQVLPSILPQTSPSGT
ncbi:hypothetical protein A0J48_016365 [Sphaerospermopsis aphanizomenoides BCCUSP55]|uniref:hypothetical protein n=1 Tax=Sphaerospermopsis aphanizomenoides TaxID=459663 RepID=UPI001908489C|nr:hypothetical protein [Sphaerospermopsis aphanizomenoides]MBK1989092.1 hypothetical protein [Sphaerospermopsis aphanizomenoides BCCUSP55]